MGVRFERVDPRSPEALAALRSYIAELMERGVWMGEPDETEDIDDFDPPGGGFIVGLEDGPAVDAICCGGLRTIASGVGEIKRMWVRVTRRRSGLGIQLLEELEGLSGDLGHEVIRLDTDAELVEAIAFYRDAGYQPIERYNDNEDATHFFEKRR